MRAGVIVIGDVAIVLSSCAAFPPAQEANDAVLTLRKHGRWPWAKSGGDPIP